MGDLRITSAEAWLCKLPLTWPVKLGPISYDTRDYVVLRLESDSGHEGWAIGYTRGTPLLESAQVLATNLPTKLDGPHALTAVWSRQFAPGWASFVRGISLFDICLWDLVGKARDQTLVSMLGGEPESVPLMAVAGYFIDDRGVAAVIDEAVRFADSGFSVVKFMLPGHDRDFDERLVKLARESLPDWCTIAVDLHGMFQSREESADYCAWLNAAGVAFIEDPYASSQWREVGAFQVSSVTPVASGEDLPNLGGFQDLLEAGVRKIRLDATTCGGVSSALQVLKEAALRPVEILPHVWPHLHVHLAALSTQIPFIEVIPDYVGADPMWSLLADPVSYEGGLWPAPDIAGVGMSVDIAAVQQNSVSHWRVSTQTTIDITTIPAR